MRSTFLLAALFSFAGVSCTQAPPAPSEDTVANSTKAETIAIEDTATDDLTYTKATQLYRSGMSIPASADTSRDGTPRDEDGRPFTHENLGTMIAPFAGKTASGDDYSSDALLGNWTVIEVWGLWCHDSMNDAPYAAALSTALNQDPDVDFMSVHTPHTKDEADKAYADYGSVAAYFEEKGYSFLTVVDEDASIRTALNIRWTPSYLLIAPDGTLQAFRTGLADAEGDPVKDFVRAISEIRGEWATAQND